MVTEPPATSVTVGKVAITVTPAAVAVPALFLENEVAVVEIGDEKDGYDGELVVTCRCPVGDAIAYWTPDSEARRGLFPDWGPPSTVRAFAGAATGSLYDPVGKNIFTWALSERVLPVQVHAGVEEETAFFRLQLRLQMGKGEPGVRLLLDIRNCPFASSVQDVGEWWAAASARDLLPVPSAALEPTYSTWYGFHQRLEAAAVMDEARLAHALGFRLFIIDDGWQTADDTRSYPYTGDWRPEPTRFPDLTATVTDGARTGLEFMLWVALPLVGEQSDAARRFKDQLLGWHQSLRAGAFDPRFPEVRRYLVDTCVSLVRDTKVVGLKLDFVDVWAAGQAPVAPSGADIDGFDEAVDELLQALVRELRQVQPGLLVEFRQAYVGPRMWRYANVFRAGDSPLDRVTNRTRVVDLRLMLAGRAVHADPLMWGPDAEPEIVAEHFANVLIAVPQVSVLLGQLPARQAQVVKHWLTFFRDNWRTLCTGRVEAPRPDLGYPEVRTRLGERTIAIAYAPIVVRVTASDGPALCVVNATGGEGLALEMGPGVGGQVLNIYDCAGSVSPGVGPHLGPGLHSFPVPRGGLIEVALELD